MAARESDESRERLEDAEARLFAALEIEPEVTWIEVPHLSTTVRVVDAGRGEPTLCIHGSPNAAATWAQLAAAMPGRRFLMLERPGSGLSGPVTWENHRRQTVDLMTHVLDHLDIRSVDVVGSSFGGLYTYYLAIDAPQRVRSMVQMGASAAGPGVSFPFVFRMMCLPGAVTFMRAGFKPTVAGAQAGWRQIGHSKALEADTIPVELFEWYAALVGHGAVLTGTVDEVRAISTPFGYKPGVVPTAKELAGLRCPTLYVWGEHDAFAGPEVGRSLAAFTPDAQFEMLPDGGHLPWCDNPERVATWLIDFFAR